MSSIKICLCGLMGAGKTTAAQFLAERLDLPVVSTGGVLRRYCQENGISTTREELQRQSKIIVEKYGQDGAMDWFIKESIDINWSGNMIFEGLRHPETFMRFRELYPRAILVNCTCDINTRIERIMKRNKLSFDAVLKIISNPITEQELEGFELLAHVHKDEFMDFRLLLTTTQNILSLIR
jgi:dephospho-CoA kinase